MDRFFSSGVAVQQVLYHQHINETRKKFNMSIEKFDTSSKKHSISPYLRDSKFEKENVIAV